MNTGQIHHRLKRRLEATDIVLQKDADNTFDGLCERRGCFKPNGKEKDNIDKMLKRLKLMEHLIRKECLVNLKP